MAKAKKKPVTNRIITESKEMKAARAGLVKSTQLAVAQNSARIGTASRGAVGGVNIRQAGTNLSGYDVGGYSDTYGKAPPIPGGAYGGRGTGTSTRAAPTAAQKAAAKRKKVADKARNDYNREVARRKAIIDKRKAAAKKAASDYNKQAARKKAEAVASRHSGEHF